MRAPGVPWCALVGRGSHPATVEIERRGSWVRTRGLVVAPTARASSSPHQPGAIGAVCDVRVVWGARTGLLARRARRRRLDVALRQRGPDDGPQGGRYPGRAGRFRHRTGDARRASSRASRGCGGRRGGRSAVRRCGEAVDPRWHRRHAQLLPRAARVGDGHRPGGRGRDRGRRAVGAGARPSLVGGQGRRGVDREHPLRRRVRCCGRRTDPRRRGDVAGVGECHRDPVGGLRRRLARRGDTAIPVADLPAESDPSCSTP